MADAPAPPPVASQTVFSAVASSAKAAVRKGRAALTSLSEQVAADEHSSTFSALQSQRSILDAYTAGSEVEAVVRRSEQREAELRNWRESSASLSCWQRCRVNTWQYLSASINAPSSWIYLILLGMLGAIVAVLVEMPVTALLSFRTQAVHDQPSAGFVIWVLWALAGGLLSAGIGHALPLVEGSGIPQVKSILSGSSLSHYLSFRVGAAKLVGLVAAQVRGPPQLASAALLAVVHIRGAMDRVHPPLLARSNSGTGRWPVDGA
jgi:hypothetical protein